MPIDTFGRLGRSPPTIPNVTLETKMLRLGKRFLGGVGGRKDRKAVAGIFRIFSLPSAERFPLSILNPLQPRTRRTTIRAKPRLTESIRTQPRLSEVKYFFCHPQFQPHPVACCHLFGKMAAHRVSNMCCFWPGPKAVHIPQVPHSASCNLHSTFNRSAYSHLSSVVLEGLRNFACFCMFLHASPSHHSPSVLESAIHESDLS